MFYPLGKNSEKPYGGSGIYPPLYIQGLKRIAFHYQAYFSEIVAIYCMISTDR